MLFITPRITQRALLESEALLQPQLCKDEPHLVAGAQLLALLSRLQPELMLLDCIHCGSMCTHDGPLHHAHRSLSLWTMLNQTQTVEPTRRVMLPCLQNQLTGQTCILCAEVYLKRWFLRVVSNRWADREHVVLDKAAMTHRWYLLWHGLLVGFRPCRPELGGLPQYGCMQPVPCSLRCYFCCSG